MEKKSGKTLSFLKNYNSVVILLLLAVVASFVVEGMVTNFDRVLLEASQYGLIAVGLTLVMITGNIDLSVGFQAASCAVVTVVVMNATEGNFLLVILAALAVGALMGFINGFTVVKLGISPLIATIATNYIYKGFVYFFTRNGSYYPEGDLRKLLQNAISKNYLFDSKFLCVTVLAMLAIMILLYFFLRRTRFGIGMYIAGDNPEAGQLAGVNIKKISWIAYVLCGMCCAVAGVFLASKSGAAIYSQGEGRDVFAISACVIGGIKMAGGKGTMLNTLMGILIMRVISTGMDLMLVPASWVNFVSGCLLIAILIIDRFTTEKVNV